MVKLRGTNVFPMACVGAVTCDDRTTGEWLCVVERKTAGLDIRDEMTVQVEAKAGIADPAGLKANLEDRLKSDLGVRVIVELVARGKPGPYTYGREGKAQAADRPALRPVMAPRRGDLDDPVRRDVEQPAHARDRPAAHGRRADRGGPAGRALRLRLVLHQRTPPRAGRVLPVAAPPAGCDRRAYHDDPPRHRDRGAAPLPPHPPRRGLRDGGHHLARSADPGRRPGLPGGGLRGLRAPGDRSACRSSRRTSRSCKPRVDGGEALFRRQALHAGRT